MFRTKEINYCSVYLLSVWALISSIYLIKTSILYCFKEAAMENRKQ